MFFPLFFHDGTRSITLQPRISLITLGVTDLERSTRFYTDILKLPALPSPPGISFFELGQTWLALFSRAELAADAGVPASGNGFPGFTLAHNVKSAQAVDELIHELSAAGVRIIKQPQRADWGGYTAYFADPDNFFWEVAWNPHFPHV